MTVVTETRQRRVGFLDDDPGLLTALQILNDAMPIDIQTTNDVQESYRWIERGEIDTFVADKMLPGIDGIAVLKSARERSETIELALLTSHTLTKTEEYQLKELGATHYQKGSGLRQLLSDLTSEESIPELKDIHAKQLIMLYKVVVEAFVAELREIPSPETAVIAFGTSSFTVAELITDLRELTPRGLRHIELWLGALHSMERGEN